MAGCERRVDFSPPDSEEDPRRFCDGRLAPSGHEYYWYRGTWELVYPEWLHDMDAQD